MLRKLERVNEEIWEFFNDLTDVQIEWPKNYINNF